MHQCDEELFRLTREISDAASLVFRAREAPERQCNYRENLNAAVVELNVLLNTPEMRVPDTAGGS